MKLNKFIASAAALLIASTAAYADKAPFKVESYANYKTLEGHRYTWRYLKIIALDDVDLLEVKVNRGNCAVEKPYGGTIDGISREELFKKIRENGGVYKTTIKLGGMVPVLIEYKLENGTLYSRIWREYLKNWDNWDDRLHYHMKYGSHREMRIYCDDILEAALTTDKETWTFSFN